ncbi:hypothetical protein DAI22_08g030200 [Oryza sativa Japonica Group]|nr:hypothetical protein DAI22_08g030200 [Oryza sativa Japonica Group]
MASKWHKAFFETYIYLIIQPMLTLRLSAWKALGIPVEVADRDEHCMAWSMCSWTRTSKRSCSMSLVAKLQFQPKQVGINTRFDP